MSAYIPGRSYVLNTTLMFHNLIYAMLVALQLFVFGRQEAVWVEQNPVTGSLDIFFYNTRIHQVVSYRPELATQLFDGDAS
jgi:hypothetical protein